MHSDSNNIHKMTESSGSDTIMNTGDTTHNSDETFSSNGSESHSINNEQPNDTVSNPSSNIELYSSDSEAENGSTKQRKSKIPPLTFDIHSINQAHKKLQRTIKQHHAVLQSRLEKFIHNTTNNQHSIDKYSNELQLLNNINIDDLVNHTWQTYYTSKYTDDKTLPTPHTNPHTQKLIDRIVSNTTVQRTVHSIIRDRERYMLRQYKLHKALKRKRNNDNKQKRKLQQLQCMGISSTSATLQPQSKQLTDAQKAFNLLKIGLTVDGVVEGINTDIGAIFIDFWYKRNKYRGMCHISQLSDTYVNISDMDTIISVGDAVRAVIYTIDSVKMRVNLSLKSTNFPADKHPIIERLSQSVTRDDNTSISDQIDSSAFITSLKSSMKRSVPEDKIHRLLSLSKGKTLSGNRLGQRERRKLIVDVYGDNAKFLLEKKIDKSLLPQKDYKNKKQRLAEQKHDEVPDPVIRYADSTHASESHESNNYLNNHDSSDSGKLHPSWAAKKQTQGIVQPTGKKVKLF